MSAHDENRFSQEELSAYAEDGYVVVPALFAPEEIGALHEFAHADRSLYRSAYDRSDTEGRPTKLALWNDPPPEPYGLFTCAARVVDRVEQLLGEEVYHWHTKMTMKEPREGGAWEWHQDYGYWYHNACLFPRLVSCMIAVDESTQENGCLQVLRGSHRLGRIDHGQAGDQTGADPERVAEARQRFDSVAVEMQPGDALFFHCNLLHRSDANLSPRSRWTLIGCYNAASNSPYKPTRHPAYKRLERASNEALIQWAARWRQQHAGPSNSHEAAHLSDSGDSG